MSEKLTDEARQIMDERFGKDSLIAVATVSSGVPYVRSVNAYYEDGCFYCVTYALSNKMRHISENPTVAICGEWFTAHGIGENIGAVSDAMNAPIMQKLRAAFSEWYSNGHINEDDPNTCILKIKLTDGILMSHGRRFEIDFT